MEGKILPKTIIEYYYKSDKLDDPLVNKSHINSFNWANNKELTKIELKSLEINELLKKLFNKISINLVDFKIEFGRSRNNILLADEISPDSCRLWDKDSNRKLDKDVFRKDIGNLKNAYMEIAYRLNLQNFI